MIDDLSDFEEKLFRTDSWRVFRIISEFVDGFETLTEIGPSVSIFGSARLEPATPYYNMAIDVAQKIAERGFAVITGGGPGIMEGANKGASNGKGKSIGLNIEIPMEQNPNKYQVNCCKRSLQSPTTVFDYAYQPFHMPL